MKHEIIGNLIKHRQYNKYNKIESNKMDRELILWVDNEEPMYLLKHNLNALTILINDKLVYNNSQLIELVKHLSNRINIEDTR